MSLPPVAAEPGELAAVVIAFDGSDASRTALERASELFPGRAAVIATVWEPGLSQPLPVYDSFGSMAPLPDPETVAEVDRAQHDHATQVARAGAELARSLGLDAGPRPVEDEVDVADTLVDLADTTGAAAIVIGSHGVTGLRSHIMGSVRANCSVTVAAPSWWSATGSSAWPAARRWGRAEHEESAAQRRSEEPPGVCTRPAYRRTAGGSLAPWTMMLNRTVAT